MTIYIDANDKEIAAFQIMSVNQINEHLVSVCLDDNSPEFTLTGDQMEDFESAYERLPSVGDYYVISAHKEFVAPYEPFSEKYKEI